MDTTTKNTPKTVVNHQQREQGCFDPVMVFLEMNTQLPDEPYFDRSLGHRGAWVHPNGDVEYDG